MTEPRTIETAIPDSAGPSCEGCAGSKKIVIPLLKSHGVDSKEVDCPICSMVPKRFVGRLSITDSQNLDVIRAADQKVIDYVDQRAASQLGLALFAQGFVHVSQSGLVTNGCIVRRYTVAAIRPPQTASSVDQLAAGLQDQPAQ